jgi:hypothetical protein
MCVKLISVLAVLRKEFFGSGVQRRGAFATGGIGRTPARRIGAVIVVGLFKTWSHGGHPVPVAPIARPEPAVAAVSAWLLVRAFSSGCTTMTGVEAVSNGVQAFRDPKSQECSRNLNGHRRNPDFTARRNRVSLSRLQHHCNSTGTAPDIRVSCRNSLQR